METNKKKKENTDLYKKNIKTEGVTENVVGEQTLQTEKTKIIKGENGEKDREVLIGKDIEDMKHKDNYESLQHKIMEKLMK
jgi:hypothetical protein